MAGGPRRLNVLGMCGRVKKEQSMGRLDRSVVAILVVVAATLAAFVVVGAGSAVAQLPVVCHGAPYVYSNVTVYKVHTDSMECHTVYGHADHLVDLVNQGLSPSLSGFSCSTAP